MINIFEEDELRFDLMGDKPVTHRTLKEIFERNLAEQVLGNSADRLGCESIRPVFATDAEGNSHPAVEFDVKIQRENGNQYRFFGLKAVLGDEPQEDTFSKETAESNNGDIPVEIGEQIDFILNAYGFNREQIYEQLHFDATVKAPKDIIDALHGWQGENKKWHNADKAAVWKKTLEEVKLKKGEGTPIAVWIKYKSGYDSQLGDIYTACCPTRDDLRKKTPAFQASNELNAFQNNVLKEFFAQDCGIGERIYLIATYQNAGVPTSILMQAMKTAGEIKKEAMQQKARGR